MSNRKLTRHPRDGGSPIYEGVVPVRELSPGPSGPEPRPYKYGLHCDHCGLQFFSEVMRDNEGVIALYEHNQEECPRCSHMVSAPGGISDDTGGKLGFAAFGSSVTRREWSGPSQVVREHYWALGNEAPQSAVWSIEARPSGDVYIRLKGFREWKLSIHRSGQDNIGYTDEGWLRVKDDLSIERPSRHFFSNTRGRVPKAHLMRIMRCEMHGVFDDHFKTIHSSLKSRELSRLSLLGVPKGDYPIIFDVFYTDGHPFDYLETTVDPIAIVKGSRGEYVTVTRGEDLRFQPQAELAEDTVLSRNLYGSEHLATRLSFGVTDRGTYTVRVRSGTDALT